MERVGELPIAPERGARRDPRAAARRGAGAARAVRGAAARPRRDRPAGHHALAVAGLVRVLPGQRVAAVDPRRARVGRPRRAGDDLVLEPGADGDRGARARLARRPARAAAALQDRGRPGRRRDPDERVGLHAPRARGRARAGGARRRADRPPGRLRLLAGALVGRARGARRRLRARAQARRRRRASPCGPEALREAIAARTAPPACIPAIVTSAIGTTGTGAVDPIAAVAGHRDASTGSGTTSTPRGRARRCSARSTAPHQAGAERADSYTFNPHKWLFTNFDCNVLWVADRGPLIETLSILPPYLRNAATRVRRGDRLPRLARAARAAASAR